jgi:error-prone DNA polymerase
LLLGQVEVDYHFPTVTISKMAKMPFVADPRYAATDERRFHTQQNIREDISMTDRDPYPQEHEYNMPRYKMAQ